MGIIYTETYIQTYSALKFMASVSNVNGETSNKLANRIVVLRPFSDEMYFIGTRTFDHTTGSLKVSSLKSSPDHFWDPLVFVPIAPRPLQKRGGG